MNPKVSGPAEFIIRCLSSDKHERKEEMIGTNTGRQVGRPGPGVKQSSHLASPTELPIGSRWRKGDGEASLFLNLYVLISISFPPDLHQSRFGRSNSQRVRGRPGPVTHGFGMDQPAAAPSLLWPGCFPGSGRRLQLICAGPAGAWEKALLGLLPPLVGPAVPPLGPRPLCPS